MRSHNYDFQIRDVFQIIGPTLIPVALFAVLMHLGARLHLLPKPRPILDVDRTILTHKIEASQSRSDAEIVLIGDSSCLMDIDARRLTQELGKPVLNLGTLSYLGLESQAALLHEFLSRNESRVKAVVLLMHPEALRLVSPGPYHTRFLESQMSGEDFFLPTRLRDYVSHFLGFEIFRGRLLARIIPAPLGGPFGRRYGFSSDLEKYLTEHRGSALEPDRQKLTGSAEYRLAPQFQNASRTFRSAVPSNIKLLVGITPVPERFAGRHYPQTREQLLIQWQSWLHSDALLTNLPPTLPDLFFAKTTHLSEAGVRIYTSDLAHKLQPHLK
jgi:hypothetical protein